MAGAAQLLPVAARGLVKRYGEILAVDDVDLNVEPGDIYGFLGPNGAGKTTACSDPRAARFASSAVIRSTSSPRRSTASQASSRRRGSTAT
jgi:ABC-type branched-subunit amino acid transport system ATPase component